MKHSLYWLVGLLLLTASGCSADGTGHTKNVQKLVVSSKVTYSDTFDNRQPAWSTEAGTWVFADHQVTQTQTDARFPLVLFKKIALSDTDVSVDFMPLSGRIDASGGVVFRAQDAQNYYIVRANALEDNFRLYYFKEGSRYEIASATVTPPPLKHFSTIRVVVQGDHIQAYLNGKLLIDHHDSLFAKGYTGLWTKADSVTAFDNFKVSGD